MPGSCCTISVGTKAIEPKVGFTGSDSGRVHISSPRLDIIKTRLQTSQVFSAVDHQPHRPTGYSEIIRQIHRDGAASYRDRYPSTFTYRVVSALYRSPADIPADKHPTSGSDSTFSRQEAVKRWTLRILGMKGFLTGLGPELGSSIIGSAVGIAAFELALVLLEKQGKRLAEQ